MIPVIESSLNTKKSAHFDPPKGKEMNALIFSYSNVELPLYGCDDSGCY